MKRKTIGFELEKVPRERMVTVKLPDEIKELLGVGQKPDWQKTMEFCLGSEDNYIKAYNATLKAMKNSLPEEAAKDCLNCGENCGGDYSKDCSHYFSQMELTYQYAVNAYCGIVNENPHLRSSRSILQKLTVKFYQCLKFLPNEGLMYFDLEEISRHCLYSGFLSLSRKFYSSPPLQNLTIINQTLNDLESKEIENELYNKEDGNYISIQKKFFQKEQRYYKEKIYLSEKSLPQNDLKRVTTNKGATVAQYALYYIYLQESGDFDYFENHPEGKLKAIEELLKNEKINTSVKYFQKMYNKLSHYKTNRVAKNQVANIAFAANTMLKDLPKAQKIALKELKEAKTKHK